MARLRDSGLCGLFMWKNIFLKKEKQNVDQQKHSPLLLQPRVHCGAHVYLSHHIACYPESLNSNLMFFFFCFCLLG